MTGHRVAGLAGMAWHAWLGKGMKKQQKAGEKTDMRHGDP